MASNYIMEDGREAGRLSRKVDPASWVDKYYSTYLDTAGTVLDVGCGPGTLAAEIARRYGQAHVVGVDLSEDRLAYARRAHAVANLSFEVADSYRLPIADNRFDLVYSRLMLEYLQEPGRAVAEMARVCRPGGRVILQDLDGQLAWHYPIPPFAGELQRVLDALSETGHDVFVGRKLFYFAKCAGLQDIAVSVEPYHLYAGPIAQKEFEEWQLKLEIARPQIEKIHGPDQASVLHTQFLEYLKAEDTLTYSVLFTVTGEVPA